MRRLVGPCAPRPGGRCSEASVAKQAGTGSARAAQSPRLFRLFPAALLAGTRGKVTSHPLSPDGRPPTVLHSHSPRVEEGPPAR